MENQDREHDGSRAPENVLWNFKKSLQTRVYLIPFWATWYESFMQTGSNLLIQTNTISQIPKFQTGYFFWHSNVLLTASILNLCKSLSSINNHNNTKTVVKMSISSCQNWLSCGEKEICFTFRAFLPLGQWSAILYRNYLVELRWLYRFSLATR